MARQQGWFALILALAIAASVALFYNPLKLGLDLRGGSQLTLEVQPAGEITTIGAEQMEAVKVVLDRRVNGLGVAESTLQTVGDDQLVLQLPGETDPTRAASVLGDTALLEFKAQKEGSTQDELKTLIQLRDRLRSLRGVSSAVDSADLDPDEQEELAKRQKELGLEGTAKTEREQLEQLLARTNREILDQFEPTVFTGKQLINASSGQRQNSSGWEVGLRFDDEGSEKFAQLTQSIAGTARTLGIFLDGELISFAGVGPQYKPAGIAGGSASIYGDFDAKKASDLEVKLRAGALPLPVNIIERRTIGPSLGAENVQRSLIAALSGLVLVGLFMLLIYRLAGAVAVMALSLYALFNLAVYALIPVTLTLPGIAGFILSIGMAVDANVLIFERIKDELRRGNTLVRSIETGFSSAFSSIVDGHLTTLISCAALFFIGTGLVKGFAATLGIGVLLSLFTALTCTRTLLRFLMGYQSLRKPTNFLPARQLPTTAS